MKPKKILHIISKYNGDYPLFDDFILNLDPSRFQNIVCFLRGRTEDRSRLEKEGIETIYLEQQPREKRGINLKQLLMIKGIVQRREIDLIHSQRHKPTVYGVLTSLLTGGRPVISTVHGAGRTRSTKRRLVNRFLLKRVHRIIAVSAAIKKDILQTNSWLPQEKVVAVRNGLDYTKILKKSSIAKGEVRRRVLEGHDNDYWFGTVGRLTPVKNHERLIAAFAQVVKVQANSILLIAGSGPLQKDLKKMVSNLNLEDKVYMLGYRNDVPEFLHSLDVFVFPSLSEGLGLAMLEAMAAGLPVVSSHIDASREVMDSIECGFYVNPENENDIRDGMLKFREINPEMHAVMGERARNRVIDSFSIGRMTSEISHIYDELLLPTSR